MDEQAIKKITKARAQLILRKPFFGYLALHLEPTEKYDMPKPTMGTDGEKLYYFPDFVNQSRDDHLQSFICHEVLHAALAHCWRIGKRDLNRWNIATDACVNYQLKSQGFRLPKDLVWLPEAENLSAEELYLRIKQEERRFSVRGVGGEVKEIEAGGWDDHSQWDKDSNGTDSKNETERKMKELQDKWRLWLSQARQIAKAQGVGMGELGQQIDNLLEPKLPWKELLKDFILSATKLNYRLIPPAKKHLWRGIYLPSTYGDEIEIGFAIDTSGSMSDEELKEALSEVKGICDQFSDYTVHLFQCDYGIQGYQELTPNNFDFPDKVLGRGGTSFAPVFEEIANRNINISCLIYFTDLLGDFPQAPPPYPVIWLATDEHPVPFGQIVRYERALKPIASSR